MNTPLAYSIAEACAAGRAGRTALYQAIRLASCAPSNAAAAHLCSRKTGGARIERLPAIAVKVAEEANGQHGCGEARDDR